MLRIMDVGFAETSAVSFKKLVLDLCAEEIELHVPIDGLSSIRRADRCKERPFFLRVHSQTDDLTTTGKRSDSNGIRK